MFAKNNKLSLKARALRFLSNREYSSDELAKKLAKFSDSTDELNQLIGWLQEKDFLNDRRAASSFLYQKSTKFGNRKLQQQLQQKGFSPELIANNMAELQASELARGKAVWAKKFTNLAANQQQQLKQMRFLAARGFSAAVIKKILANNDA